MQDKKGNPPIFLTGAYAVVYIAGKKLAFCRGISVRIDVPHSNSKVLGMYESADIQPQAYNISGSFSVYRYIAEIGDFKNYFKMTNDGNGVGTFGDDNFIFYGRACDNFNPALLMYSTTFDISVFQVGREKEEKLTTRLVPAFILRQCRLVSSDISIFKREIATQTFSFIANYIDEDSFISTPSGTGGW